MYDHDANNQECHYHVETQTPWMLPENFTVSVDGDTVGRYGWGERRILPTINHYRGDDGGYVAIYTHRADEGVYSVGGGIYVAAQIRVQGHYHGRCFVPTGYRPGDNITQDSEILRICADYLPEMKGHMWIGGDTGGWFGIP